MSSNQIFHKAVLTPAEHLHFDTATFNVKNSHPSMEPIQMNLKVV